MATAGGAAGKRRGKGDHREGYLMKKSPGMLKLWQRRYFVLDDGVLTYYKDHRDVGIKYLKQMRMDDVASVIDPDDTSTGSSKGSPKLSEFDFVVELDDRAMTLRAESIERRVDWVEALHLAGQVRTRRNTVANVAKELGVKQKKIHAYASDSLNIEDIYEVGEMLGSGVAGEVHSAMHRETGQRVAIKTISKRKFLVNERSVTTTRREIDIMKKLSSLDTSHPHVVDLYAVIETAANVYIVMELVEGGELFDHVVARGAYTEAMAADVMRKMCHTLGFLHGQGVVHRDLKPENILCKKDSDTDIKITDFGLSNIMTTTNILQSKCGTPVYMAPEMLQNLPYDQSVDVWAAGIILYIILSGTLPFYADNPDDFLELVRHSDFSFPDSEWEEISEGPKDLIRKILVPDPRRRFTIRMILEHPWLKMEGEDALGMSVPLSGAAGRLSTFKARRKFRAAALAVKAANRLLNCGLLGSIDHGSPMDMGETTAAMSKVTFGDGEAVVDDA